MDLTAPNEPPPVKVEFRYDYLGRRIEKRVLPWNPELNGGAGDWDTDSPTKVTRFVWSGWLMLLELDGLGNCGTPGEPAECVVRKYTWGLGLAGLTGARNRDRQGAAFWSAGGGHGAPAPQAAGGASGLLAIQDLDDLNDRAA